MPPSVSLLPSLSVQSWKLGWLRTTHCLSADLWDLISSLSSPSFLSFSPFSLLLSPSFHLLSCLLLLYLLSFYSFLMSTRDPFTCSSCVSFWYGGWGSPAHRGRLNKATIALCSWGFHRRITAGLLRAENPWVKNAEVQVHRHHIAGLNVLIRKDTKGSFADISVFFNIKIKLLLVYLC